MAIARTKEQKAAGISISDASKLNKTLGDYNAGKFNAPPAARGNDFAPAFESEAKKRGMSNEDLFGGGSTSSTIGYFSGENSAPDQFSVLSNAGILDNKITKLDSQVQGLPNYGSSNFDLPEEGAGTGDEYGVDEILGLSDGKKKKKNPADLYENDPYTKEMMNLIRQQQRSSDAASQATASGIESRFAQLAQQQEAANTQGLARVKQALNLGGSSRYAPVSSEGIVSAQVAAGTRALSDLASQEEQLISQARQAQTNNDYQLLEKKLGLLENVRQEKAKAEESLNGSMQEQAYQSQRDNEISTLVSQGITSPADLLEQLNYDKSGKQIGDFTLKEVSEKLAYLQPKNSPNGGFKLETKSVGPLLATGLSMPDVQGIQDDLNNGATIQDILGGLPPETHEAVMKALGADTAKATGVLPGVGADGDPLKESMIRTRLFPQVASILNTGSLSDTDREIIDGRINYFRDNGLSEQQILDVVAGWNSDVSTPFNGTFRDIIMATQEEGKGQSQDFKRVGSLLDKGNYTSAMNVIEQSALDKHKDDKGFMGSIPVETYTKKIDRIKQLLKQGGVWNGTGPLEGSFDNLLGRFKSNESADLKSQLTDLYSSFRKENAGTATTDSEMAFLEPLFASITDKQGNFLTKLDTFQRSLLDAYNSTRRTSNLPEVNVKQVLDPNERLYLYTDKVSSDKANSLDI